MKYSYFLLLFFLTKEFCSNKAEKNYIRKDGYCMWYGQCGTSPLTHEPLNCLYNGPAKPVDGQESHDILAQFCPEFLQTHSNVCCSYDQLSSLQSGFKSAQQMMARCPSCWKNFRELYCQMSCSPNNSMFINVTRVVETVEEKKSIMSIQYFVDKEFRDGLYNSCKNVIFPNSNKKIMNFMCGTSADKCNPLKFLRFIGNPNLNGVSPFLIEYPTTTGRGFFKPMNTVIRRCNETFSEPYANRTAQSCACPDCPQSCHQPLPIKLEYMTTKIIVTLKPSSKLNKGSCYRNYFTKPGQCLLTGTILRFDILQKVLQLQHYLANMSVDYGPGKTSLGDFCFKASPNNCIVTSVLQYWQNDVKKLNKCIDPFGDPCTPGGFPTKAAWGDHLQKCTIDPFLKNDLTVLKLSCISSYGIPVPPQTVLGGYEDTNYADSSLLYVSFAIKKRLSDVELKKADAWQAALLKYLQNFKDEDLQLAYVPFLLISDGTEEIRV